MSTPATTKQSSPLVTWFFYLMEFVFATVSGYAESGIYRAYTDHDWSNAPSGIARAAITQIAIVFFGIAAVKASQHHQKAAVIAANVLTFMFAFVAVWFIHESALINADVTALLPAYNQPVNLFGFVLDGRTVDPWLIACLPLFQVALNWLAPIIVSANEVEAETAEVMEARYQREELEKRHKAKMAVLNAQGRRAQFQALRGKDETDTNEDEDDEDAPIGSNQRTPEEMDALRARMLTEGFALKGVPVEVCREVRRSLLTGERREQLREVSEMSDAQIEARVQEVFPKQYAKAMK